MLKRLRKAWPEALLIALCIAWGGARIALSFEGRPQQQTAQYKTDDNAPEWEMWNANDTIAAATVLTALIFFGQLLAMLRANRHFRVTERAYLTLSHRPPGIYWENPGIGDLFYGPADEREYWVRIDIRVKNFGRTPAHVTEICLAYKYLGRDEKLPDFPSYAGGATNPAHAFLVAGDEFTHMSRTRIAIGDKTAVWNREKRLIVFGYVEYRDKFGTRHRGRYARRYENGPEQPAPIVINTPHQLRRNDAVMGVNNLTFVDQARYNSDITQRADGSWPDD